jgi:predicted nucleotidyltransferase
MSRVYRYDEIIHLPRPGIEDFARELDFARASLDAMHQSGDISGAFLYGSAITDPNPRSDIDVMVSTPAITDNVMIGVRSMTRAIYNRSGIPVDVACFTENDLRCGHHNYYREHLLTWFEQLGARHPENIVGRHPAEITQPLSEDLFAGINTVLGDFLHTYQATFMQGHDPNPEATLETILNLPHKAGREAIGALLVRGRIPADSLNSTRKFSIAAAVEKVFGPGDPAIIDLYATVADRSSEYTAFVDFVHQGGADREAYEKYVRDMIESSLPNAILLAAKMQRAFQSFTGVTDR